MPFSTHGTLARSTSLPRQNEKVSLRTRGLGGRSSRYIVSGFALRRCWNSTGRYSAAPKREFRSQFPLFPLNSIAGTTKHFRPILAQFRYGVSLPPNYCWDLLLQICYKWSRSEAIRNKKEGLVISHHMSHTRNSHRR